MSKVVFILGAGASMQSGAPLMANFLDVAKDLLRTDQVQAKKNSLREFSALLMDCRSFTQKPISILITSNLSSPFLNWAK